jgi:D-cysteine desulfhydrase
VTDSICTPGEYVTAMASQRPSLETARLELGSFPTPVTATPELGRALGVPNLYCKNDGVSSDRYGGNKVRKLEFLLAQARRRGNSRVMTSGGVGSNHVLATATHARAVGLDPAAVQFPQPVTPHVRSNLRALARFEPDLSLVPLESLLPPALVVSRLRARFSDTQYVPPGGSSPTGTLGFVAAGHELARQVEAGDAPHPDAVVVPASSGGTLAGLLVGFDRAGLETRLVGVPVVERYITNWLTVTRLANRLARRLDEPARFTRADFELLTGHLGDGYAEPTEAGERAQRVAADHDLHLDPTYTAKTVAAIGEAFDDERVLYWHTLSESRPDPLPPDAARARLPDRYGQFLD